MSVQLVSKISNLCDHKSPTSQTDRRTDGRTDGRRAIPRPRICTKVHCAVKTEHNKLYRPAFIASKSQQCLENGFDSTIIISGTGKATDFKFGGYIYKANPNKSPLKFGRKESMGVSGTAQVFGYPLLSQERVKLRTSNFEGTFIGWIGTKAHEKCWA